MKLYFLDHYLAYDVNIQATCDAQSCFVLIGIAGPGVMPDRDTVDKMALDELIEELPLGYVAIGTPA